MGDPQLMAFWAPFLLMHIGGPDTITAYSLEDNELWLRHLVGLVFQTLLTFHIILLSWDTSSWLSYLSIPLLIIGCVKYGERTCSLYSACSHYREDFTVSSYISESEELCDDTYTRTNYPLRSQLKAAVVSTFSDMVLRTKHNEALRDEFFSKSFKAGFALIHATHGAMYDFFYAKASVRLSIWGGISWSVTLLALVVVLTLHITSTTESNKYLSVDHIVTLILLLGAIISHFVSTTLLIASFDWTFWSFMRHVNWTELRIIKWLERQNIEKRSRTWNSMPQCNFFTLLCSEKDKFYISGNSLPIRNVEKIHNLSPCPVSSNLKKMLFENIKKRAYESTSTQNRHGPRYRELVIGQRLGRQKLIIENLKFHQSILLWHIVTNVCYYHRNDSSHENFHSRESKVLSDYMFYLLMKQRHMLPIGTGLPSLRDTLVEAIMFCEDIKRLTIPSDVSEASKTILQHIEEDTEYVENHPKGRSVFRYAFVTANDLLTRGDNEKMWDFLMELWIEILNHTATQCRVDRHAQQLAYGGEFVSHIWVLQFFANLVEQF